MIGERHDLPLGRFVYATEWTPLRGAYLYPLRYFDIERSYEPNDYLEVIRVIAAGGRDVAITRGGGLFVRMRDMTFSVEEAERIAAVLNLVQCEFALHGLVSHPVVDSDVQAGKLIGRHASITGGYGSFGERTWGPYALLTAIPADVGTPLGVQANPYWPPNFYWTTHDPGILDQLGDLPMSTRLEVISPTLPSLVVAACHHAARHNIAETILASWIVCEEILSGVWDLHVEVADDSRRKRLRDARTYSVSVRLEVLLTAGILDEETYSVLHVARKVRNDLAHRSAMSQMAAGHCVEALRAMLQHVGISTERLHGYSIGTGGIGSPQVMLEPGFQFE